MMELSELKHYCIQVREYVSQAKGEWPWDYLLAFPSIETNEPELEQPAVTLWWFGAKNDKVYGSYMHLGESIVKIGDPSVGLDLLADHCREVIERVGAND